MIRIVTIVMAIKLENEEKKKCPNGNEEWLEQKIWEKWDHS